MTNILLVGRRQIVIDDIMQRVRMPGVQLVGATDIDGVRSAFARMTIDQVIIGGGIDLESRLEIVRAIFHLSSATTVHMNSPSGPDSFLPFVQSVLATQHN